MQRLPAWARWSTITGKVLIGLLAAAAVVRAVGRSSRSTATAPVAYDDDHRAFQVRFDRQRARRFAAPAGRRLAAAVLGLQDAAVDLPREAAGRVRIGGPPHRAGERSPDRRSRAAGVSASIRSDSTARFAIPAPCAMRLERRRASCWACLPISSTCSRSSPSCSSARWTAG